MWQILVGGLVAIAATTVTAILQFYISRSSEEEKNRSSLRTSAYVDYVVAVAGVGHATDEEARRSLLATVAGAKARICIYGSEPVVKAMSKFEDHPTLVSQESRADFLALCARMREREPLDPKDAERVLLGSPRRAAPRPLGSE